MASVTAAHIATLHGERREVRWKGRFPDPYVDDGSRIDAYVDDNGSEYWADAKTGRLVQVGPAEDRDQKAFADRQAGRLTVHELRDRALAVVTGQIPDFPSRRSGLHPLEDNDRKRIYYFRWDDLTSPVAETRMPPFVQVGLWADGDLASYTETLTP